MIDTKTRNTSKDNLQIGFAYLTSFALGSSGKQPRLWHKLRNALSTTSGKIIGISDFFAIQVEMDIAFSRGCNLITKNAYTIV